MSCTKNGRIKKLIKRIKAKSPRITSKRTPECYITINYYQLGETEADRRALELKRLEEALKGGSKKGRMRKFEHKKNQRAEDRGPRKKKGKG